MARPLHRSAWCARRGGSPALLNVGARGGYIPGIPVVTTDGSPHTQAAGGQLVLIDITGIASNTDGIDVAMPTNVSIWVSDSPDSEPTQLSLFEEDSVALKVVSSASWEQQRENGAVVITAASAEGASMYWASEFNGAGSGEANHIKAEIDKATKPLASRIDELERQVAALKAASGEPGP